MEGIVHNGWMDCGGLRRVKARGSRRGDNVYKGYELCLYAEHANVLDQESKTSVNPYRDHEKMAFFVLLTGLYSECINQSPQRLPTLAFQQDVLPHSAEPTIRRH